jgi:glycerophosphoryl diester phosphodiesterase
MVVVVRSFTQLTHRESIELINAGGSYFTPELKAPEVEMPFTAEDGTKYDLEDYRRHIVEEYIDAGIPPEKVWLQSFIP